MKKYDNLCKEINMLETYYSIKTPVMEAEHAMDDRTPLALYDCLVPKIKEHRRFRITKDSEFSIADFKSQ